ncbi:MAG: hypothetical protein HC785_02995 [Calothrix sp. CSU_2_0]|nr:hypothetical protein [Calothrix sp. CSU_2_0]
MTIGGYTDLLLEGVTEIPSESSPLLRTMRHEINRTNRLVRDLIIISPLLDVSF